MQEAVNPEVLPPYKRNSYKRQYNMPRIVIFSGIGAITIIAVSSSRLLFPALCFGIVTGLIIQKSRIK